MDASANASVKESKFEIVWLFTLEIPVLPFPLQAQDMSGIKNNSQYQWWETHRNKMHSYFC